MSSHLIINLLEQLRIKNFGFPLKKCQANDANFRQIELIEDFQKASFDVVHRHILMTNNRLIKHDFDEEMRIYVPNSVCQFQNRLVIVFANFA